MKVEWFKFEKLEDSWLTRLDESGLRLTQIRSGLGLIRIECLRLDRSSGFVLKLT